MKKLLFIIAFLVSSAVLYSSASTIIQRFDKHAAFSINPLNNRARLSYLYSELSGKVDENNVSNLKQIAQEGLEIDPYDARFYSIIGLIEEAGGNEDVAQDFYIHARKLMQTEQYALLRRFAYQFKIRDYLEATKISVLVYLRWKNHWPLIEPYLPILLSDADAYNEIKNNFPLDGQGLQILMLSLRKSAPGLDIAQRLLLDWHKENKPGVEAMVARINASLVQEERYAEAYRLFFLTLDKEKQKAAGYIFDSSFDHEAGDNPFDWRFKREPGVSLGLKKTGRTKPDDKSLEIRFLGRPTNFKGVNQNIRLPASQFKLEVVYTNKDVKGPKPVIVGIFCKDRPKPIVEIQLEKSFDPERSISKAFQVPDTKCDLQRVSIYNDNFSKSWKNLYSGTLLIHDIRLELAGG